MINQLENIKNKNKRLNHFSVITEGGPKMAEKIKPEHVRVGAISATIWENTGKNTKGGEYSFNSVTVERGYKDGEEWKSSSSFRVNDLPKLILALQKAYEKIVIKGKEE